MQSCSRESFISTESTTKLSSGHGNSSALISVPAQGTRYPGSPALQYVGCHWGICHDGSFAAIVQQWVGLVSLELLVTTEEGRVKASSVLPSGNNGIALR